MQKAVGVSNNGTTDDSEEKDERYKVLWFAIMAIIVINSSFVK